jgi:hypothetical protein
VHQKMSLVMPLQYIVILWTIAKILHIIYVDTVQVPASNNASNRLRLEPPIHWYQQRHPLVKPERSVHAVHWQTTIIKRSCTYRWIGRTPTLSPSPEVTYAIMFVVNKAALDHGMNTTYVFILLYRPPGSRARLSSCCLLRSSSKGTV